MKALKMEAEMDSWNDERLDELSQRMDDGFKTARKDLALVRTELKGDIAEVRTELKGDIAEVRTELKGDIAQVRAELKGDIAGVRTELKGDIAQVKDDLVGVKTELKGDIAGVKTDLKGVKEAVAGCATKEELGQFKGELKAEIGDLNKRFDRLLLALTGMGLTFGIAVLGVAGGVIVKLT